MNAYGDIIGLLRSDGDIPRERVLNWIASNDLEIWSVLYDLTDKAYWRIKPELGDDRHLQFDQGLPAEMPR